MKGVTAYALAKKYSDKLQKGNESRLRNAESAIHGLATMNINNDALVTETTKDAISVLPKNASERPLKVEFYGNTLVNLLGKDGNGDVLHANYGLIQKNGNVYTYITGGQYPSMATSYSADKLSGDYFLIGIKITSFTGNTAYFRIANTDWGATVIPKQLNITSAGYKYIKVTRAELEQVDRIVIRASEMGADLGFSFEGGFILTPIDQATYDAIGTTLTDADVERMFPYVDSVQHVKNPVLSVAGKNLNPWRTSAAPSQTNTWQYLSIETGDPVFSVADDLLFESNLNKCTFIKLKPNTTYTYHFKNLSELDIRIAILLFSGKGSTYITRREFRASGIRHITFTTGENELYAVPCKYFTSGSSNWTQIVHDVQLELGDKATSYEPYNPSHLFAEVTLAGNKDKKDVLSYNDSARRWEKTKWWETLILKELDWSGHANSYTENHWSVSARVESLRQINITNAIISNYVAPITIDNYEGNYQIADKLAVYKAVTGAGLYFKIPKSEIDGDISGAKAKEWFERNDVKFMYPLNMPVIEPVPEIYGTPIAKPNSHLTFGNVLGKVWDYGVNGIVNDGYTFSAIRYVAKVDRETGAETDITASCTLNAERNGFTSTELKSGDLVWYELEMDNTAHGEVKYSYYDSRFVIEDEVNGKMYDWKIVANDGVPSIVLVEI